MQKSIVLDNGKIILPLLSRQGARSKLFVEGQDEYGRYVACRLKNRSPSVFCGWYVFVSPEDQELMEEYNWCGHVSRGLIGCHINIRRRANINGRQKSFMLGQEIWSRCYDDFPRRVYNDGHPLDFRRELLSDSPLGSGSRGITRHHSGWQVQISLRGLQRYVGIAKTEDEGRRMFNRHLRTLKHKHPDDQRLQALPYNDVKPRF